MATNFWCFLTILNAKLAGCFTENLATLACVQIPLHKFVDLEIL